MEKYPFFLFFRKMLMSAFLLRFKVNYDEKMHGYSLFFFVDSNSPYKDLLFLHGCNLAQIMTKKMHGYSLFFFVDSNSPYKDLLFPHGCNLAQKPLYLVGTNLSHRYLYNFILYID